MNEKKFVVVRVAEDFEAKENSSYRFHCLYVSNAYNGGGFSYNVEDSMKFEKTQADAVKNALEIIENIHCSKNKEKNVEVHYEVKEIQK